MLAREIMTTDVIAVTPITPVKELARTLNQHHISGTPVIDKDGNVIGIVSSHDLIAKKGDQVKAIMTKDVIGVHEETPVEEIASLMATRHIKRVPVMRGQKLTGIVCRGDIIRALALGEHVATLTPIYDL